MTDNEIIKALECCEKNKFDDCFNCPCFISDGKTIMQCMSDLMQSALNLINRQKAEIEKLNKENENLLKKLCKKVNQESKAIEKLIKAEAIKEVAEEIKIKTLSMVYSESLLSTKDYIECIDNVVKEKVGDTNE